NEGGRISGYCQSCGFTNPWINGEEMPERAAQQQQRPQAGRKSVEWVHANSTVMGMPERGLRQDIADYFGIRVGINEATGEVSHHYYPYYKHGKLAAYKVRDVAEKDFRIIGEGSGLELFGSQKVGEGGKLLIVTEGELDAVAATQMLKDRGKNYRVVSLPNGANSKSVRDNIEWLETFEHVFLALDQDEPGARASAEIAELLTPGKVKVMTFSEKDANDMLLADRGAEFFNSVFSAQAFRPDGIVSVDDVIDEAMKPVEWGLSWPWETLTRATYGYRRAEIYGFGAGSGCGKTEGFKEIIDHVINVHKLPVGVIFLEEPVAKTLKVLAGKKVNKRFHIPEGNWTIDELRDGINDLRGKVYLYNHFGSKNWENIKSKIKYMVLSLGIKDIFLDHLTALVAQEADEYKALNKIMEEMASLVQELDCTIFYISHLRKAQGTPHEEGGHVSADQFKGSGAIVFWSNFLFGYERNQQADEEGERNTTTFRVLKDRNTGLSTGRTFKLWYDHPTGRWREKTDDDGIQEDIM
ncbi:MAG: toprim domain-containing protein, partial [Gammaproteobacteria bacterium]|nr:toprim domain-containing protein [Gammaproteobacteria bacterium]